MTTITVRDLVEGFEAIKELSARKLKINPSFWLARQQRKLAPDFESFSEKRDELIKQFGQEVLAGSGNYSVAPEHLREFAVAVGELLDATLEVTVEPRPVEFLALDELEPRLLVSLHFLFTDGTPPV